MSSLVRVVMRARSDAAISKIAKLMDVEAMQISCNEPSERSCNLCASKWGLLFKEYDTFASLIRLRVHDANSSSGLNGRFFHIAVSLFALLRGHESHTECKNAKLLLCHDKYFY